MGDNITNISLLSANNSVVASTTSFIFEGLFTQAVWALLILLVGLILGKIIGHVLQRLLEEVELDKYFSIVLPSNIAYTQIISSIITKIIYVVTVVLALNQLKLTALVFDTVSIIIIIIVVVLVLMGIKDFIQNIIAGIFVQMRRTVRKDDIIHIDTVSGRVIKQDLLETIVQASGGDIVHIPNAAIFSKHVRISPRSSRRGFSHIK